MLISLQFMCYAFDFLHSLSYKSEIMSNVMAGCDCYVYFADGCTLRCYCFLQMLLLCKISQFSNSCVMCMYTGKMYLEMSAVAPCKVAQNG